MAKKLTQEEQINQMFNANLASQKESLQQDYEKADADYVRQQEAAQKATDANLTRTAVEAQKEAVNNAEINNAAGLSSGARAQLRLSNENQTRSDMTALRMRQQEIDAETDRARSLLSQEYASAIRKAQQDNDLARAEALYAEAQRKEDLLRAEKKEQEALIREQENERKQNELLAAQLLAGTGNYSRIGKIYGLSDSEIAALVAADAAAKNDAKAEKQSQEILDAAQIMAKAGDYTLLGKYYGLSDEEIAKLNGTYQEGNTPVAGGIVPIVDVLGGVGDKLKNLISGVFSKKDPAGNPAIENTQNTQRFISVIPTQQEYAHTYAKDGQYSSYKDFVESKLDEWLQRGDLTENELATLLTYYNIV